MISTMTYVAHGVSAESVAWVFRLALLSVVVWPALRLCAKGRA